jgi:SAM-dependent methyltransferase
MARWRPPNSLKRLVLPFWNGGHRLAWRVGEYLGAVRHGRFGVCDVCGRFGPWLYRRRVVSPKLEQLWGLSPRQAEALARKESLDCVWCGAKLRARRLARVVLELYPSSARSVFEWAKTTEACALRVAEINRIDGLHKALRRLPNVAHSDFHPEAAPGSLVDGVRSEDLTRLTYSDASFDLVLTSESLEHVPDLAAALTEIRRVLIPGGYHVFTVPVLPGVAQTFARMRLRDDGTSELLVPEIRHPGGDLGYPVFTEFGVDLTQILETAGFETRVRFGPVSDDDLAQVYLTRKVTAVQASSSKLAATGFGLAAD